MIPPTFVCQCGGECFVEPDEGPAICPRCCEASEDGHDLQYERGERTWVCQLCGEHASNEWLTDLAASMDENDDVEFRRSA